jgi:hypothetical protein
MTWLSSRETREARTAAQLAEDEEQRHRRDCFQCIKAVRQRHPDDRCAEGRELDAAKRETAARLRQERELDKAPIPGQEALFDIEAS